jgi:hypothetical protein
MELAAAKQPMRGVSGLKRRALRRRMGCKVARHGNQDMPARIGVASLRKLPHARPAISVMLAVAPLSSSGDVPQNLVFLTNRPEYYYVVVTCPRRSGPPAMMPGS